MRFHSCVTVCACSGIERSELDSDVDPLILPIREAYERMTALGRNFAVNLGDQLVLAKTICRSGSGAGIFNIESPGTVASGLLVLGGRRPRVEQKYACEFMRRMAFSQWRLPLPPLEIDRRPLLYMVFFRLGGPKGEEWYELAAQLLRHVHGFGLAFLASSETRRSN